MTKKQQEINRALPMLKGKEIRVWTNGDRKDKEIPDLEGTVEGFTGSYLLLKNVIIWNGTFYADHSINAGFIARITLKT